MEDRYNVQQGRVTGNSTAEVYGRIKELLLQNYFDPREKFNQGRIAKELGVSRTPVIKALHKLESEGLVDNIPQKGFYVHQLSVKELVELFALREALEMIIIGSVAETITPQQANYLEGLFAPFGDEWTPVQKEQYKLADRLFHDKLFAWCSNQLAQKVDEVFQVLNRTYLAGLMREPSETLQEHRATIAALMDGDKERAQSCGAVHVARTRKMLEEMADNMHELGVDPGRTPVGALPRSPQ